jgi:hypothetical protein
MRRDGLPPTFATYEDIREPNRDVVRNVAVFAPTMGASCDHCGIPKHSDAHVVPRRRGSVQLKKNSASGFWRITTSHRWAMRSLAQ